MTQGARPTSLARSEDQRWQASWNTWSGSDQAEGELYKLTRDVYRALADGVDLDTALEAGAKAWATYAASNNAKVASAGKIQYGPRKGQSGIHYRWVSPELFASKAIHLRTMARIIRERHGW